MTTATFDLLHPGHINLLKRARELGDYLVVGLNSDNVAREAGKQTYYTFEQRRLILESIRYVDKVLPINRQEDKYGYMRDFNVAIFAIGSDYIGHWEMPEIEKYAKLVFFERTPGISSTQVKAYLSGGAK